MATAKRPGGLYGVNGVVVDADGRKIDDADPIGPDTPPSQQLGATGGVPGLAIASGPSMADQIADGIARGLAATQAPAAPTGDEPKDDPKDKGKK